MIFFKEKTVTLGRCDADMQEWLGEEIMQWLDDQWSFVIKRTDEMISFRDDSCLIEHRFSINPMKSIKYGEIHFLPQNGEIEIVVKLRPSGIHMFNIIYAPVFLIFFSFMTFQFGITKLTWIFFIPIIIVVILSHYSALTDEYMKDALQKIIAKKNVNQIQFLD